MTFCYSQYPRRITIAFFVAIALLVNLPLVDGAERGGVSTGLIPIDDLGSAQYLNVLRGGLYGDGINGSPTEHTLTGIARARSIRPLDTDGNPSGQGKIVLLSIGFSNVSQEFCAPDPADPCKPWSFTGQALAHSDVNKKTLAIVNGAAPSQGAKTWTDPDMDNYNRILRDQLIPAGLSEAQVQAVWVKFANAGPTVSLPKLTSDALRLLSQAGQTMRTLKIRYPNLQIVFVSSRIYAGYATSETNPEPFAYESGFSVRWLIQGQIEQMAGEEPNPIAGDLDIDTVAPWIGWGPYLWADGLMPRSDGLTWALADFESDGVHPAKSGETLVGSLLLDFMLTSPFSTPWFTNGDGRLPAVWVDTAYTGKESGEQDRPFNALTEALAVAAAGGVVNLLPSSFADPVTISKSVTLQAPQGTVILGRATGAESRVHRRGFVSGE